MSKDGSDNLRRNLSRQFPLSDPRRFGFAGVVDATPLHPVGYARPATINLSDPFYATQDYIDPVKAQRFANSRPRRKEPPWLVQHEGRTMVWDGHHSIAGAMLRGQKRMKVQISEPIR